MADSEQDQFERALADAIEAAIVYFGRSVRSITVDVQDSGEYPYRVFLTVEDVPAVGVARELS